MQFYVSAGDGTPGRKAGTIRFLGDQGVTWTMRTAYDGFHLLRAGGGSIVDTMDVNEAARTVAGLLYQHRDQSLVVESFDGGEMRGDESRAADVFPPHRHPRINVEGP